MKEGLRKINLIQVLYLFTLIAVFSACESDEKEAAQFSISRIYPNTGAEGEFVNISGSGFSSGGGNIVTFNGKRADIEEIVGDTLIRVTVPEGVIPGYVSVQKQLKVVRGPFFTVLRNATPPKIESISTTESEVGEVITITGAHFLHGSDSATARNIVRVENVKTAVLEATSNSLKIVVPAVSPGERSISVTVLGEKSNTVPIVIKRFDGTLHWSTVPGPGAFSSGATQHYIVTANADGSSAMPDRTVTPVPSSFFPHDMNTNRSMASGYNQETNRLYFTHRDRSTYKTVLFQASPPWSSIQRLHGEIDQDLHDRGVGFSYTFGLTVSPDMTNEQAYLFANNTRMGELPFNFIGVATPDASEPFRAFADSNDPKYSPNGMLTGNTPAVTATEDYLYAVESQNDPVTWADISVFKRILRDETGSLEQLPFQIPGKVYAITYHKENKLIYFISGMETNTGKGNFKLYSFSEGDGAPSLITDKLYTTPRHFTALETPTGTKLYWIARTPSDADAIWLVNLKADEKQVIPIVLYKDMQEISGKPETRIKDSFDAFYPPYISTFLIADMD